MSGPVPQAVDLELLVHRATGLLRRIRIAPGDRLVTLLENSPASLAVSVATQLAGVVQVPLPPDLPPREVGEVTGDAEPAAALVSPTVPVAARPGGVALHVLGELADEDAVEPGSAWPLTRPMFYTSGTTGRRKGVWAGVNDAAWGRAVIEDEHRAFGERHGDRHLVVSPLHHSGPSRFATVTTLLGGRVAVLPRFDAALWRATLRRVRPSSLFCVPTQLHRLLALPELCADDLASLRLLAHAGASCPLQLKEQVMELAPDGSVWEFYGSTEGQFTVCPPQVWRALPGTVGRARPGRRLEVRDDAGRALPAGEVGTVWVHAPSHARWRYWRDPERTARAWDGDAFTVGDLGALDAEGRLTLRGRHGDLVISGGVNVYPALVEHRLLEHPDVAEAVVFGLPDPEWGERVVAAVVPRPGRTPGEQALRDHARAALRSAEVPKRIVVVDALPRTTTGKVRRAGLAAHLGLLTV
ncbi:MAG TPA: AMP-binding protein [Nitriliruptorales bacterium]|nr:AMP-binding protein [Nitriliruptorales bacterium]